MAQLPLALVASKLRELASALEESSRRWDANDAYVARQSGVIGDLTTQLAALRFERDALKRKRPAAKKKAKRGKR